MFVAEVTFFKFKSVVYACIYVADGSYAQSSNLWSFHTVRWKASWCLRIYTIVALLLLRQQKADILKSTSSQRICFIGFIIWCIEQWATFEKLYQCYTSVLAVVFLRHQIKKFSQSRHYQKVSILQSTCLR